MIRPIADLYERITRFAAEATPSAQAFASDLVICGRIPPGIGEVGPLPPAERSRLTEPSGRYTIEVEPVLRGKLSTPSSVTIVLPEPWSSYWFRLPSWPTEPERAYFFLVRISGEEDLYRLVQGSRSVWRIGHDTVSTWSTERCPLRCGPAAQMSERSFLLALPSSP